MPTALRRRRVRPEAYAVFFLLFAFIVFLSHSPFLGLPYFWDEAGQFIPTARDLFRDGSWIAHSTSPNIHPPGLSVYLSAAWHLTGYGVPNTRLAILLLASLTALAAFLLAIELSRETSGAPALVAAALLLASPLFFAQSMLAQLDLPATLLTSIALLAFLQNRLLAASLACTALVLTKESGVAVPLVFAAWLGYEWRWREAVWFVAPVAALACWVAVVWHATGNIAGNPEFLQYNVWYPLHPVRIAVALVRRAYELGIAGFHWVGAGAILYAFFARSKAYRTRPWRIAGTVAAAQVLLVTLFGGATLARYLLPVLPILYAATAIALAQLGRTPRLVFTALAIGGVAVSNFINPPYPFAYENNLAVTDFLRVHAHAAEVLERDFAGRRVTTMWPLSMELSNAGLGFVTNPIGVSELRDFSPATLQSLNQDQVEVLVIYSRNWNPEFNLMRIRPVMLLWQRFFGYVPHVTREEAQAIVRLPRAAHVERRGQWLDIYAR